MSSQEATHVSMDRKYTSSPQSFYKSDNYGVQNHYGCKLFRMRLDVVLTCLHTAIK
jgi:hypothetical protein